MSDGEPMRLLYVAAPDTVGGLERVVQALAMGLHRRRHQVAVAAVVNQCTRSVPFIEPLVEAGVRVEALDLPGRAYVAERRAIRRLCEDFRPDVLHTHGYRPDVLHAGLARALRLPIVTTMHGSSRMGGLSRVHEWLQRLLLWRFDAVVSVSKPLLGSLEAWVPRGRLHLIPNAGTADPPTLDRTAARRALGLPDDGPCVAWVGRLIAAKGPDVFLEAVARLQIPGLRAVIVGDGRERAALEARSRTLGLQDRVRFLGHRLDVARSFRAFDVFALTSRTEGTPLVLFEAMGAGVPIVATAVGGVPDVLSEHDALLVPIEDPDRMAQAVATCLTDHGAAQWRARRARERLHREFGTDPWLDRHEALYRRLVTSPSRR